VVGKYNIQAGPRGRCVAHLMVADVPKPDVNLSMPRVASLMVPFSEETPARAA
jgi:hypothetical protein